MKDVQPTPIATAPPAGSVLARTRTWRHRLYRYLVDRRNRRHAWLALATLLIVISLAAAKSIIGYYIGSNRALTLELTLGIAVVMTFGFGFGQKRLERALEARFMRNTHEHRRALAALADELAAVEDRDRLAQAVVDRFDALFGTRGSALYRCGEGGDFVRVAANDSRYPDQVAASDLVVQRMIKAHAPVAASELASPVDAPMVWPLRIRGQLAGFFAAGEHHYIESFDPDEIAGVTELANAAATTLALLEPARAEHTSTSRPPLPLHLSSFLGRDEAMLQLRDLLRTNRLTTVTGPVGIGKSRLLLQVAEAAMTDFPGGVYWADLGACIRDDEVPAAIARGLGAVAHGVTTRYAELAVHVGPARTLLVLDGCESIRDGSADAAATLLAAAPALTIAATSQQALGVPGEHEFPLPPLSLSGAVPDALSLFLERARAVQPALAPDAATQAVLADICAALDGMPLAIELAAARMKFFDARTIRDGLYAHAATGAREGVASGAGTLQASLAASFAHLTAEERVAAHALAGLDEPFTLADATADAFGGDAEHAVMTIAELVDKSWLCRLDSRGGTASAQYRMLAPLRRYALERGPTAAGHASGILLPARDPAAGRGPTP
jgi:predicted ATPase